MTQTVLLTGVSGYIAKRIAFELLTAGHSVVGTLRTTARETEVRATLIAHGLSADTLGRLRFVSLDLTSDTGWAGAMQGVDAVIHTASPFPLAQPKDENDLIKPAVDGTLRVLRAAQGAGIVRIIVTSSLEAIMHGHKTGPVTEADWSDMAAPTVSAYTKSKILAEQAAWEFVERHPEMRLTSINPGLVLGTPMDRHTASSISVIARIFNGKDPVVPNIRLPVTDIADVAAAHVAALDRPGSAGERFIVADRFVPMPDMAHMVKEAYPTRRIATRVAPRLVLRLLALFDPEIRLILPLLDWQVSLDSGKVRRVLGVTITPAKDSILASARFLAAT